MMHPAPGASWRERAESANRAARFLPQVDDDTLPMIEVAGVQVYAYLDPDDLGVVRVSVNLDTPDADLFGSGNVPLRVDVQDATVYDSDPIRP
jgi:hypothetical protein